MVGEVPPSPKPAVRAFLCPQCGATLEIKAIGQTVTVGCRACGSVLDTAHETVKLLQTASLGQRRLFIPLGTRGYLRGVNWEVIGAMGRSDMISGFIWTEYLLFNPYQGFHWLSEANGHWSYIVPLKSKPKLHDGFSVTNKPVMKLYGKSYTHFQKSQAKVQWVLGEFYWRVAIGDQSTMDDYVRPPEMLSSEKNGTEILWSLGEYVEPEVIRRAFHLKTELPLPLGIAPNQPCPADNHWKEIAPLWRKFLLVTVVLFIAHLVLAPNKLISIENVPAEGIPPGTPRVIGPFELQGTNNVEVSLNSPSLLNQYIDLDADLVNESTGQTYEMQVGAEYYAGYDSEGSWTEGSRKGDDLEPSVPPGRYHLSFTQAGGATAPYSVSVRRGAPVPSNFVLAFLLLSAWPLTTWIRSLAFESSRWAESDYAPVSDD